MQNIHIQTQRACLIDSITFQKLDIESRGPGGGCAILYRAGDLRH